MTSVFEGAAKAALEEIVRSHVTPSKFGSFVSDDQLHDLVGELYRFLQTSRRLQAAGERAMYGDGASTSATSSQRIK